VEHFVASGRSKRQIYELRLGEYRCPARCSKFGVLASSSMISRCGVAARLSQSNWWLSFLNYCLS
jgi:hypothetical protein